MGDRADGRAMSTPQRILIALAATAAAVVAATSAGPAAAHSGATSKTFTLHETRSLGRGTHLAPSYGWPVKPFDRQHAIRAFLDDPRIGHEGGSSFHFGIDIAAPDGTAVYAVTGGVLYRSHGSLAVVADRQHTFGYWHVRADPTLREHQLVERHQLLGWTAPGWGHVHFAERVGNAYMNPLRPGALGPYTDPIAPAIDAVSVRRHGHGYSLVAHAHDTTWPPVPGAWANEPVTPALLEWRLGSTGAWHVAADFRQRMLSRDAFG